MINAVKIWVNGKELDLVVGSVGITKIFVSKEDSGTLVVLMKDEIVTYTGFPFICTKDYKEKGE